MSDTNGEPYVVGLVVDDDFGERLTALARRMPVWIVNSAANRAVTKRYRQANPSHRSNEGITTFSFDPAKSPEDWCAGVLQNIDLHHGEWSHNPPYAVVDVYGVASALRLKDAFAEFGLSEFDTRDDGFRASRPRE